MRSKLIGVTMAIAVAGAMLIGCTPKTSMPAAMIEDKVYTVTPGEVEVKAGIVGGSMTQMKITERVEQGSGRVESPAKLSGNLKLSNTSADQSVRLLGGRILYIDDQNQPIKLEEARTEPELRFQSTHNAAERLDPGQEATQPVEVDFPTAALKDRKLKEIRIELAYIPSSYKVQTSTFAVSIGEQ